MALRLLRFARNDKYKGSLHCHCEESRDCGMTTQSQGMVGSQEEIQ